MDKNESGKCQCGKISYTFNKEKVISAHHCHCKDCQRATGCGKATIIFLAKKNIEVTLKYFEDKPVIKEFQRESKPGLRRYFGSKDIPEVKGGLGIAILTTSRGVITDKQAKSQNIGGELICTIF